MKPRLQAAWGGAIGVTGVLSLVCTSLVVGCSDSSGAPTKVDVNLPADGGADGQEGGSPDAETTMACRPSPQASEDLSGRVDLSVMSAGPQFVKVSDLFTRFNSICGGCHVATSNGGFQTNAQTFATVFDASRLARIESNDPSFAMPPVGKAFSSRGPADPVRILATYLEAWLAQGRPVDMFVMPAAAGSDLGSYAYTAMSNLGDCVPSKAMYESSSSDEMTAKDTFFQNATALPSDLTDTDLTTFDTAALAANGVIAYRPTYALWSAGSGKLRFIRVPKGKSIVFHKDTQTFDIPPYTRFYKTFFRKVIDKAGKLTNRKMETRLIVALPDGVDTDGVTPLPKALYGTYLWNEDESSATLWNVPYRDGTGFTDDTVSYIADEIGLQDLVDNLPTGAGSVAQKLEAALIDPANAPANVGVRQHYAVPGSLRCVQCHRGSPTKDFVLGFYPLQVAQRAAGTGGTYDQAGADELNQLQRFIDYGLITGMASPADVVPLELSELPRTPRTDQELNAQAYMIGNCAHCHNPRGYPSLLKPVLAPVLNFLPFSTPTAGIFQFDLETYSPVRSRGANQDVPIPYITPSLRDLPVADDNLNRLDNGANLTPPDPGSSVKQELTWSPKYDVALEGSLWAPGCNGLVATTPIQDMFCRGRRTGHSFVPAPWRSLIYRNVDTPFPYFDDYVPFPHMPMNTAGFDCRAPRIMGDWMVSIPATLKPQYQGLSEDVLPHNRKADGTYPHDYVDGPQPYQEVKPGSAGFAAAQAVAQARLADYHSGSRYNYCQDVLGTDILDPVQPSGFSGRLADGTLLARPQHVYFPIPSRYLPGGSPPMDPLKPGYYVQPAMGIPYHAEWFDYDPTEASPWAPRRSIWPQVLQSGIPDTSPPAGQDTLDQGTIDSRRRLTAVLQKVNLTEDLRSYATTPVPYGLWQKKPECAAKFAKALATGAPNVKKVSDFTGANRPSWMDALSPAPAPDDLVYMMAPGEALYRHICINCHGPKADGHGLQSDALAASSEGQARPANFAAGLFGPLDNLGANMVGAFDPVTHDKAVAEKWASRYMPWMTLGGTLQLIPQDVINQVQATTILGESRKNLTHLPTMETASANMLNLAKGLCSMVLPDLTDNTISFYLEPGQWRTSTPPPSNFAPITSDGTSFIFKNGDFQMWMKLCSEKNRQIVRVYRVRVDPTSNDALLAEMAVVYYADDGSTPPGYQYPSTGQVWDQNKNVRTGVTTDNYFPTCMDPTPVGDVSDQAFQNMVKRVGMPLCDAAFIQRKDLVVWDRYVPTDGGQVDAMREWALRGAINAGMSVFSYLEGNNLSLHPLPPYYNECQLLP